MHEKKSFTTLLRICLFTVFSVIIADQCLKIWIKTHLHLGEEFHIAGNWFILHFTENNGMAFGMELSGEFGKLILSLFRILAATAIGLYCYSLCKKQVSRRLVLFMSLIFAGAVGNIIDSAFYGLIFSESNYTIAEMFPEKGYASFLHGKVVDMFYFPIIEGHFPSWFPFWGNEEFVFFRPVFNIADSAITVGVICLLLFQSHIFQEKKESSETVPPSSPEDLPVENKGNEAAS